MVLQTFNMLFESNIWMLGKIGLQVEIHSVKPFLCIEFKTKYLFQ